MTLVLVILLGGAAFAISELTASLIRYRREAGRWKRRANLYLQEIDDLNQTFCPKDDRAKMAETLDAARQILRGKK